MIPLLPTLSLPDASETCHRQDTIVPYLLSSGAVTEEDLDAARDSRDQANRQFSLVYHLVDERRVDSVEVTRALATLLGEETIDLSVVVPDPAAVRLIPSAVARQYHVLAIRVSGDSIQVALVDPYSLEAIRRVREITRLAVHTCVADEYSLRRAIRAAYASSPELDDAIGRAAEVVRVDAHPSGNDQVEDLARRAEVPQMVEGILSDAVEKGASDVHFEFYRSYGLIRYRIDGVLRDMKRLDPRFARHVAKRIKVTADMNSAQARLPEDGMLSLRLGERVIDFRVSTLPTADELEHVVLRILDRHDVNLDFDDLGLEGRDRQIMDRALQMSRGMILVTGPTGSGKSTTLHTGLTVLAKRSKKILAVEDPVERRLERIPQVQVRPDTGLTFDRALETFLRQDPDVIMVGEIRETTTARTALRAAMTGHLVLSTLHTNCTTATIARLIDIGMEPYNLVGAISVIVAQRLVRRICRHCKRPYQPGDDEIAYANLRREELQGVTLYHGLGCDDCENEGYRGRTAIYETLEFTPVIRRAVMQRAPEDEIREIALREGMTTLRDAGIQKIRAGITTIHEMHAQTAY